MILKTTPLTHLKLWAALAGLNAMVIQADIPEGYYDSVVSTSPQAMRSSLHDIIDDHQRFPYTASQTDTWDILELADQDPDEPSKVVSVYRNQAYSKVGGGNNDYNREHSWPKSFGFPDDNDNNYPYTDAHHLFIADGNYNEARSNKPFNYCDSGCSEYTTTVNNGQGGGGQSNWTDGVYSEGNWEVWTGRRGDIARAMFYMDLRYEGGVHGQTGAAEPDLILTNDRDLIANYQTASNASLAYMGFLDVLLQWHQDDPVDDYERNRNQVIYGFQGNRNPLVDHPEYVSCLYENLCESDTQAPATPEGLVVVADYTSVALSWTANSESDLAGYLVFRSEQASGEFVQVNSSLITDSSFQDTGLAEGATFYYQLQAIDTSGNHSGSSNTVSVTTLLNEAPTAEFSFSANALTVSFTSTSSDPEQSELSWLWQFGDDSISTEQNPTHTYANEGTFHVLLKVTDQGLKDDFVTKSITVTSNSQDASSDSGGGSLGLFALFLVALLIFCRNSVCRKQS